jgi:hypothetical protein
LFRWWLVRFFSMKKEKSLQKLSRKSSLNSPFKSFWTMRSLWSCE